MVKYLIGMGLNEVIDMKIVIEREMEISYWNLMSVSERESLCLNIMMVLGVLGASVMLIGAIEESILISCVIYLFGGCMTSVAVFIAIYLDTISHYER